MSTSAARGKLSTTQDAAVTHLEKWDIDIWAHAAELVKLSMVPLQDVLEAFVFVTFAFGLDDRPLFGALWFRKFAVVAAGFIATDLFAPSMANAIRLGTPILFYAEAHP